jgi:hypothetical protein
VKKGEVNGGIPVPETLVKLYAVDYLYPLEEVNVFRSKVSMSVADSPIRDPALKKASTIPEKPAARLHYKVKPVFSQ